MPAYGHACGPFAKVHTRFVHQDQELDWEALRRQPYDPRTRERGRRSFVLRALDEQRSLLAFSELLSELCEAGAPIDVIGSLARVVRDEALHVDLCGRVVESLGGWPDGAPEPSWVRSDRKLPLRQRILKVVVGSLCIGETLSVAMIAGVREHATDPVVHALLTRLLADESFHSRFGWWWLSHEADSLTAEDRALVGAFLPRAFAGIERAARPPRAALEGAAPFVHGPFGAMSPAEREEAFMTTLKEQILPGFEELGLDAAAAWDARPRLTG